MKRIEKQLPCKITLNVVIGYDKDENPIKQKLMDVYAKPICKSQKIIERKIKTI